MPARPAPVLRNGLRQTPFAEAYRTLRANLNFAAAAQGVRSVLVTSSQAGEGKTTTLINLGILLAEAGRRVILVDADFRRPSLARLLETAKHANGSTPVDRFWHNEASTRPGLSDMIAGDATFVEVGQPVRGVANLVLVPAGSIPPNPGELLASPSLRNLMVDLCDHADLVLVDSPPCALYSDPIELTQVTDGLLYILRPGPQPPEHQRMLRQLQQGKARLLGLVINELDTGLRAYEHHERKEKTAHA